jgi:hypothetical protein
MGKVKEYRRVCDRCQNEWYLTTSSANPLPDSES